MEFIDSSHSNIIIIIAEVSVLAYGLFYHDVANSSEYRKLAGKSLGDPPPAIERRFATSPILHFRHNRGTT